MFVKIAKFLRTNLMSIGVIKEQKDLISRSNQGAS